MFYILIASNIGQNPEQQNDLKKQQLQLEILKLEEIIQTEKNNLQELQELSKQSQGTTLHFEENDEQDDQDIEILSCLYASQVNQMNIILLQKDIMMTLRVDNRQLKSLKEELLQYN